MVLPPVIPFTVGPQMGAGSGGRVASVDDGLQRSFGGPIPGADKGMGQECGDGLREGRGTQIRVSYPVQGLRGGPEGRLSVSG